MASIVQKADIVFFSAWVIQDDEAVPLAIYAQWPNEENSLEERGRMMAPLVLQALSKFASFDTNDKEEGWALQE
jgi:hypothetical protein